MPRLKHTPFSDQKQCSACKQWFPPTTEYFRVKSTNVDGLTYACKVCLKASDKRTHERRKGRVRERVNAYNRAYNVEQREKCNQKLKRWRAANPEKARASTLLRITRHHQAEGHYTEDDIKLMMKTQHGRCWYCQKPLDKYDIDHRIPLSRGGSNDPGNLVLACPSCNRRKSDKLPHEWSDRLL